MVVDFVKYRKIYYILSGILVISSLFSLIFYRLNFGIDFTGGSILTLEFKNDRPTNQEVENKLADLNLGEITVQPTGENDLILRVKYIDEAIHQQLLQKFNGQVEEKSFDSIGPTIGKELTNKTFIFIFLVLFAIILFIAFAFRKSSRPVSSWQYGLVAALVAFLHDVLIPLGVFSLLGKFYNIQVTIPIVVGLLTILGYSVHDTIVVFDRIRENISRSGSRAFELIVNDSLNQTLVRSINTSLTTLLVLLAIFFVGGETLRYFSLILILGIITGTYSSIFIASPILVSWLKFRKRG
ncbi:MAG: protein translocase subunit SecF [Patescibacteria group bacterium]